MIAQTIVIPPMYRHQEEGAEALVRNPRFALFDEMGLGKTRQVIDAAQRLAARGEIDAVIVVCPAAVRAVWFDPVLGEIRRFHRLPAAIEEFHRARRAWELRSDAPGPVLRWMITNYDYARIPARTEDLLRRCGSRTMLVLDESSAVKNHAAKQTRACRILARACGRVVLLNGTPVTQSPGDIYSQADMLDSAILGCRNWYVFRARYAIMGGWRGRQIRAWRNVEDLQRRMAPHAMRREKQDCLDLPPKLPTIPLEAPLGPAAWAAYRAMRDEFVAWLDAATVATAPQAGARAIRLSQITSGHLGGVAREEPCRPCAACALTGTRRVEEPPRDVGAEKLGLLADLLWERAAAGEKVIVWARFRRDVERAAEIARGIAPTGVIWGNQDAEERGEALTIMDPRTAPAGPAIVVGTPASGGVGLNLAAASTVIYLSNDYSLRTRLQSEDRVHRPGQTRPVTYVDLLATGPNGEKTIDHAIAAALRDRRDAAEWTVAAWRKAVAE